jgi:transcriptional regulator GlxA family with amidase domain
MDFSSLSAELQGYRQPRAGVSRFNRAFKRHFGATPSSLRRSRYASDGLNRGDPVV